MRDIVRQSLDPRVRRFEDSEDILQEALLVAAKSIAQRDADKFLHYMEKLAHHRTVSANRRHLDSKKHPDALEVDFSAEFNERHQPAAANPEPVEKAEAEETWERLVEKSPEPARTLLRMKAEGYSNQEIAERIQVHERTIRKMIDVIREKFQEELEMKNRGGGMSRPSLFLQ